MFKGHERVILTNDVPEEGLKAGDVGAIVHIHQQGAAFEVEFLTLDGETAAIATVPASQVRPVTNLDITHARRLELPV
jgi:hypothetical protein